MGLSRNSSIKYKLLSFDELVINLDRLTRFKLPEDSYNRVFSSILFKCLISPKYSKKDIENLNSKIISKFVQKIWNESVKSVFKTEKENDFLFAAKKLIINRTFKNIDDRTKDFINTRLNIAPLLNSINYSSASDNLRFWIKANGEITEKSQVTLDFISELRKKYKLKFPIEKILIVEGITEEILLPVFAEKLDRDFSKSGIYVLGAGGKSKSPSLYINLKNKIKIPFILLFDADAKEICKSLNDMLDKKDKIIIIQNGEFEDILSLNLIKRALNTEYEPITPIIKDDLHIYNKMCENIENFYRTRNLGEFKKSKLSKVIAKNIKYDTDITEEIKNIVQNII